MIRNLVTLHQGDDLAEYEREGSVLRNDLLPPVQGSIWSVRTTAPRSVSMTFSPLLTVAREAKEWIAAHSMKR